jgi:Spy/CpxP family protein refolding chaperone
MWFARALAGCALLATLVVLSSDGLMSQEKKDTKAKEGKIKGQLPQGWSKLDLTAAQKEEIYRINAEAKEKVDKLQVEMDKVKAEAAKKRVAVLTDEQKKKLAELVTGESKDAPKEKSKTKEPDK